MLALTSMTIRTNIQPSTVDCGYFHNASEWDNKALDKEKIGM